MKKFFFIVALSILPLSITQADVRWFIGGGGALVSFDDGTNDVRPTNVFFRGGLSIIEYLDVGIEVSSTLISDDLSGVDFDVDTSLVYIKGNLPINDDFKLYALIGRSNVELTGNLSNVSVSRDGNDTGYGFGFEYDFNNSLSLSADYIRYFDDSSIDLTSDALNVGVIYRF